jgi:hypothetical protein
VNRESRWRSPFTIHCLTLGTERRIAASTDLRPGPWRSGASRQWHSPAEARITPSDNGPCAGEPVKAFPELPKRKLPWSSPAIMSTQIEWLQGRSMQSVHHDAETREWIFDFGDAHVLQVAAPWRLLRAGTIALGHRDHNQRFGLTAIDGELDLFEAVSGQPFVVVMFA